MRDRIQQALRELYGPEVTTLDKISLELITEGLLLEEWFEKEKWATYNQVLFEFKSIGDKTKIQELQYHLTDRKDPKIVCLDLIDRIDNKTNELCRLYEKISTF